MDTEKDDKDFVVAQSTSSGPSPEPIYVCKCVLPEEVSEEVVQSERQKKIFTTVSRTENYLRERRIPELIRFLLTKILASQSNNPCEYMLELLDECMVFRAGLGVPPVVYEDRHLQAIVKSFDPGERGWLTAGQARRAFKTLGIIPPDDVLGDKIPTEVVLEKMQSIQERELFSLLSAGMPKYESSMGSVSNSSV